MKKSPFLHFLITITILQLQSWPSISQQAYINNDQFDCNPNHNNTNGFLCNGNLTSCTAYVTFRSQPPAYATAPNIAFLLNSTASVISQFNNVSAFDPIPANRLLFVPVQCSCARSRNPTTNIIARYYQHNAMYKVQSQGEAYFTMANKTYQGLTTCQAMMNQNNYSTTNITIGDEILVPLMCACPTSEQITHFQTRFIVSYIVTWGDDVSSIASMFGVDSQRILDANELKEDDVIYPFNPLLIPLDSEPRINISLTMSPIPSPPGPEIPTSPGGGGSSSHSGVVIGIGVGAGVLAIVFVAFLVWFFVFRKSKKEVSAVKSEGKPNHKDSESTLFTPLPLSYTSSTQTTTKSSSLDLNGLKHAIGSLTVYKYREIEKTTDNFSDAKRIKGSMYRGEFNGDQAAIKVLKGNVPSHEINILKHLNHSNIIRLSGYCIHEGNTYLVYEYAEKGSLDNWLFRDQNLKSEDNSIFLPALSWKQRVQIASNVADALNYLHSYINPPYIHKNLKSSNIILDTNFRAKITNFGLARTVKDQTENGVLHLTKHVVGTHGYLAPEYIENGAVTTKLDVFSFGVVILELLSGKPAVKPSGKSNGGGDNLLFLVIRKVFEGENIKEKLMEFMDSNLGREYPLDLAYTMAQLGYKCVDSDMNSRPSMFDVALTLSKIYSSSLDWDPSDELGNSSSLSYTR